MKGVNVCRLLEGVGQLIDPDQMTIPPHLTTEVDNILQIVGKDDGPVFKGEKGEVQVWATRSYIQSAGLWVEKALIGATEALWSQCGRAHYVVKPRTSQPKVNPG